MGAILTACCLCNIEDKWVLCMQNRSDRDLRLDRGTISVFSVGRLITVFCGLWLTTDSVAKSGREAGVYPPKARSCNFVEGAEKWFCMDQIAVITIRHITIYTEVSLLVTADCQLEACIKTEWMIKRSLMWLPKNVEKKFIVRNVKIQ